MTTELQLVDINDPQVQKHVQAAKKWFAAAEQAYSPNTIAAFRFDIRLWLTWCRQENKLSVPATAENVCLYIDYLATRYKPASIKRYVQSLNTMNLAADAAPILDDKFVKLHMRAMRRSKGVEQDQARPIHYEDIERIISNTGWIDPISRQRRFRTMDIRDLALIMVAYDTMLRGSELARLRAEDIEPIDDGAAVIKVRRSKSDQEGEGDYKYLRPRTLQFVTKWLSLIKVRKGFIFWSLSSTGSPVNAPLTLQAVSLIYKKMMAQAGGQDAGKAYSSHSTRIGACQDLHAQNVDLGRIMRAGSWKDPRMPVHYNRKAAAASGGMAELARKQSK